MCFKHICIYTYCYKKKLRSSEKLFSSLLYICMYILKSVHIFIFTLTGHSERATSPNSGNINQQITSGKKSQGKTS